MKQIIKPATPEEATYSCDFTGENFFDSPATELKISCGYGSKYDGAELTLHLSNIGTDKLIHFLKENLHIDTIKFIKNRIEQLNGEVQDCMDSRDWHAADYCFNSLPFLEEIVK